MLRLLFEEDEVGRRAIAAERTLRDEVEGRRWPHPGELRARPGTRPLTAGEVVENWDEVLGPRGRAVAGEDAEFQLADIDDAAATAAAARLEDAAAAADALAWRPEGARCAARAGRVIGARPGRRRPAGPRR